VRCCSSIREADRMTHGNNESLVLETMVIPNWAEQRHDRCRNIIVLNTISSHSHGLEGPRDFRDSVVVAFVAAALIKGCCESACQKGECVKCCPQFVKAWQRLVKWK